MGLLVKNYQTNKYLNISWNCVCVHVYITFCGPNVEWGNKTAYKSYKVMFFENVNMQNVSCDG